MSTLWTINPSKRRKAGRSGKKRRSAKQRAATRRMIAANRGYLSNPRKKRRGRKSAKATRKYTRRASRKSMRRSRRRGRSSAMKFSTGNAVSLLKSGAIGGAGAVLVDVGMGQISRFLPASLAAPADAAGNIQYGYFGTKAALAIALGTYGGKFLPRGIAEKMAEGSLTVLAYSFFRPFVPAGLALGYFNPAPTMKPGVRNAGAYVAGAGAYERLGAYERTAVRSNATNARGGRAANVLQMVGRR